jgi:hypothetical protein
VTLTERFPPPTIGVGVGFGAIGVGVAGGWATEIVTGSVVDDPLTVTFSVQLLQAALGVQ